MFCTSCGCTLADNDNFCAKCGAKNIMLEDSGEEMSSIMDMRIGDPAYIPLEGGDSIKPFSYIDDSHTVWKLRKWRWLIGLLLFWFISASIASIVYSIEFEETHYTGVIIICTLLFAIFCEITGRRLNIFLRILTVIGAWIAQSLTAFIFTVIFMDLRLGNLISALIIVFVMMRRSTFFVEQVVKEYNK